MADITRYDQPAQAQFMNYYEPIPFQEISQAGAQIQQRYNQNRGQFEQFVDESGNLKYIPKSADKAYIESVTSGLKDISDKYASLDYGDPEIQRQLRREVNKVVDRNRVAAIQQSAQNWEEAQKIKAQMLAKGQTPYKPFDYTGYDTGVSGVYTETPTATLNYEGALQDFFSNVGMEALGPVTYKDGTKVYRHGKSLNKLQDYASSNVNVAQQNPAIRQYLDSLGIDPNNTDAVRQVLLNEAPRFKETRDQVLSSGSNIPDTG